MEGAARGWLRHLPTILSKRNWFGNVCPPMSEYG